MAVSGSRTPAAPPGQRWLRRPHRVTGREDLHCRQRHDVAGAAGMPPRVHLLPGLRVPDLSTAALLELLCLLDVRPAPTFTRLPAHRVASRPAWLVRCCQRNSQVETWSRPELITALIYACRSAGPRSPGQQLNRRHNGAKNAGGFAVNAKRPPGSTSLQTCPSRPTSGHRQRPRSPCRRAQRTERAPVVVKRLPGHGPREVRAALRSHPLADQLETSPEPAVWVGLAVSVVWCGMASLDIVVCGPFVTHRLVPRQRSSGIESRPGLR